jgi:hypothetical protein
MYKGVNKTRNETTKLWMKEIPARVPQKQVKT